MIRFKKRYYPTEVVDRQPVISYTGIYDFCSRNCSDNTLPGWNWIGSLLYMDIEYEDNSLQNNQSEGLK